MVAKMPCCMFDRRIGLGIGLHRLRKKMAIYNGGVAMDYCGPLEIDHAN